MVKLFDWITFQVGGVDQGLEYLAEIVGSSIGIIASLMLAADSCFDHNLLTEAPFPEILFRVTLVAEKFLCRILGICKLCISSMRY